MSPLSSRSGRHSLDGTARVFLPGLLLPPTGIITAAFLTRRLEADGYGYWCYLRLYLGRSNFTSDFLARRLRL